MDVAFGSTKPVVWVSGPDKGGTAAWLATRYAVRRSGGRPMRVTPSNRERIRKKTMRKTGVDTPHALIIGGGADIDPERYEDLITDIRNIRTSPDPREPKGQRWRTLLLGPFFLLLRRLFSAGPISVDQARDDLEWALLKDAIAAGIPVLGICRGAQLINVFHKGTLYQDLATYYRERPTISTIYPRKEVRLDPESRLFEIFGREERIRVNSLHNQAVKKTGNGIVVVARETAANNIRDRGLQDVGSAPGRRSGPAGEDGGVASHGGNAAGEDGGVASHGGNEVGGGDASSRSERVGDDAGIASSRRSGPAGGIEQELDRGNSEIRIASVGAGIGVAQAIEHREYNFMIGVQWHPEYLPQVRSQRRLFDELIRCAILHRDAAEKDGQKDGQKYE